MYVHNVTELCTWMAPQQYAISDKKQLSFFFARFPVVEHHQTEEERLFSGVQLCGH